jgi:hypothetical protein
MGMPDMGLTPDAQLSPADQAVKYLLDRVQHDPDLRWLCGVGTQSFRLLILAEAARTGETEEAVLLRRRRNLLPAHHRQEPEVLQRRREVQALREKYDDWTTGLSKAPNNGEGG